MAEKPLLLRRNFALRMHGNLDDFFAKSVGEQLYLVVYADLAHKVEAM